MSRIPSIVIEASSTSTDIEAAAIQIAVAQGWTQIACIHECDLSAQQVCVRVHE